MNVLSEIGSALQAGHVYALVAGESSGDTLGAGLIRAIRRKDPKASFIGIGGPAMQAEGLHSLFDMDELSVMGFGEVVAHLVPILRIRHNLIKALLQVRPRVVIGIDSPDFNFRVERKLKEAGIPAIHYVSPSVWAWREGRLKTVRASCDEVLALLPFEKEFYDKVHFPCTYVGHTLANAIPLQVDTQKAREELNLAHDCVDVIKPTSKIMGVLPGSRKGELKRMVPIFARTARLVRQKLPDTVFISVAVSKERAYMLKDLWLEVAPDIPLTIFVQKSRETIACCDAVLLTCGTVALETMLLKKPMAVAYRTGTLAAAIARRLLKIDKFSLPNLLARGNVVKEFIQEDCTPEKLSHEMINLLRSDNLLMKDQFLRLHKAIRLNSDELAAEAVFALLQKKEGDKAQAQAADKIQAEAKSEAEAAPASAQTAPAAHTTASAKAQGGSKGTDNNRTAGHTAAAAAAGAGSVRKQPAAQAGAGSGPAAAASVSGAATLREHRSAAAPAAAQATAQGRQPSGSSASGASAQAQRLQAQPGNSMRPAVAAEQQAAVGSGLSGAQGVAAGLTGAERASGAAQPGFFELSSADSISLAEPGFSMQMDAEDVAAAAVRRRRMRRNN